MMAPFKAEGFSNLEPAVKTLCRHAPAGVLQTPSLLQPNKASLYINKINCRLTLLPVFCFIKYPVRFCLTFLASIGVMSDFGDEHIAAFGRHGARNGTCAFG